MQNPYNPRPSTKPSAAIAMANSSVEKLKGVWNSQINHEEKWGLNSKLLRSFGLFVGSIFFMRNFGELMSI